jgi:cation diffusion facilitator family transporter
MHDVNPDEWRHSHNYLPPAQARGELQTRRVIALTATMMVVEIVAGSVFGSMALLADGWHMASHASALGITAFAYYYARRHADDSRYSFGTWKVGVLGGYSSAVVLAIIALLIAWESVGRLFEPVAISFDEAVVVACLGLGVNLVSAWMLRDGHVHSGGGGAHAHDHNLRAAYFHVLADALTSFTAIFALLTGKYFGWIWMDPLMGVVGSIIIGRWSYGLLRDTSRVLLDGDVEAEALAKVRAALEENPDDLVADLHLWRVGPRDMAALISIVAQDPKPPQHYKRLAMQVVELSHVAVEVNRCPGPAAC